MASTSYRYPISTPAVINALGDILTPDQMSVVHSRIEPLLVERDKWVEDRLGAWHDVLIARAITTGAGALTVAGATVTLKSDSVVRIDAVVVMRQTADAAGPDTTGEGGSYTVSGVYRNVAGVVTIIGGFIFNTANEDQAAWDGTLVISGETVEVQVSGSANQTILWLVDVTVRRVE